MQASAVRVVIGWGCQGPGPVPPRDLCSRQRVAESQTTFPQSCRIRFSARAWALRPSIFRCKIWNVSQSGDGTVRQWQARQAFRPNERRRPSLSSKIHASWQQPLPTPVKLPHLLPPLAHTHTLTLTAARVPLPACGCNAPVWPSPPLPNQPSTSGRLTARPARLWLVLARPRTLQCYNYTTQGPGGGAGLAGHGEHLQQLPTRPMPASALQVPHTQHSTRSSENGGKPAGGCCG